MPETESSSQPLRVCYFGTYRQEYSRNQIMIAGLRRAGVEVIECHAPLWHSIEDRVQTASGAWRRPSFWGRLLRAYARLLRDYWRTPDFDVLVVGYPGQFDVYLARLLSWLRRKPLVWDIFMSIYLIAVERGLDQHSPFTIGALRRVEWLACRLPDLLILDTAEYARWFENTHGVPASRFHLVPTGADDRVFHPPEQGTESKREGFSVLYYGTFIPNHGVDTIVEAARRLSGDPEVHFELIGEGPEKAGAMALAQKYGCSNLTFTGWMAQPTLVQRILQADVCLGAFGTTPQSLMTVQNKIYEGLALGRPVLTGDSPALRQALRHGEEVYLCGRADGQALANAILALKADPQLRLHLGANGRQRFLKEFDLLHNGLLFRSHLLPLCSRQRRPGLA